jgi:hypothetical protein
MVSYLRKNEYRFDRGALFISTHGKAAFGPRPVRKGKAPKGAAEDRPYFLVGHLKSARLSSEVLMESYRFCW